MRYDVAGRLAHRAVQEEQALGRDRQGDDHGHRPGRRERGGQPGLAHEAKPVELAGEVSRIFLGVQIQCAQCHDHKTDSWKREQFHEFAAFFSGTRAKPIVRAMPGQLPIFEVDVQGRPRYTMPDLANPAKQIPIAPKFFLASAKADAKLPETIDAIAGNTGASYITGQDNPWFARAFVNRMWYALVGESFYDAVDDIGPERTPKAPEVIETLADQWQKGGYDIRWLLRTITGNRGLPAAGCADHDRRGQDRIRLELSQPASFRPDCRGPERGTGLAGRPGRCPDRRLESWSRRQTVARRPGSRQEQLPQNGKKAVRNRGARLGRRGGQRPGQGHAPGRTADRIQHTLWHRPLDPQRRCHGHHTQALFLMNGPMVHNRTQARPEPCWGKS